MTKLEEFTLKVRTDLVRANVPLVDAPAVQEKTLQAFVQEVDQLARTIAADCWGQITDAEITPEWALGKAFKQKVSEFARDREAAQMTKLEEFIERVPEFSSSPETRRPEDVLRAFVKEVRDLAKKQDITCSDAIRLYRAFEEKVKEYDLDLTQVPRSKLSRPAQTALICLLDPAESVDKPEPQK